MGGVKASAALFEQLGNALKTEAADFTKKIKAGGFHYKGFQSGMRLTQAVYIPRLTADKTNKSLGINYEGMFGSV